WMPSFDLPSLGGGSSSAPAGASLAVESDPPGAQASTPGGGSCVTPCRLAVAATGPFTVNVALNGYVPQSVPVRVMQPDDPRLGSEELGSGNLRLDPNPVYVELERAPAPAPAPAKKKTPRHPATSARQAPPTAAQAPAPSAPTTAVAPSTAPVPVQQPMSNTAPWPMPR